jgi:hypothetical protein
MLNGFVVSLATLTVPGAVSLLLLSLIERLSNN